MSKRDEAEGELPGWALEAMAHCARAGGDVAWAARLEAARTENLFADASEEAWYARFPTLQRIRPRDLTPPEQWRPVDHAALDAIFGEGGELARLFERYEPRAGQTAMAHAVADALNTRRFLLAEAGTGVGKSLAYLVPCALWACANDLPIVVSTNTRNLQTQLLTKDIPLVRRIVAPFLPPGTPFAATVLKGRNNYLCLKRLGYYIEGGLDSLRANDALLFAELVGWAARTHDGDLDAFRPTHARGDQALIRHFDCRADACTGKSCRFYRRCFLQASRQAALGAHLIIANHALVFAELTNPGALPPHAQIVFDEAHNIEGAATDFLSGELSPLTLYDLCQKLAPSRGREAGSLFHQARADFVDKASLTPERRAEFIDLLADLRMCGADLAKAGTALFDTFHGFLSRTTETTVRYRTVPDASKPDLPNGQPQLRREVCLRGAAFIPADPIVPEAEIQARRDAVAHKLSDARKLLNRLLTAIAEATPPAGQENPYEDLVGLLKATGEGLGEFGQGMDAILAGAAPDMVYWMARLGPEGRACALTAAPLDIARQLQNLLYKTKSTLILSSATLRIHGSFAHIRARLGLAFPEVAGRVDEFVAESPFDYPRQCRVLVPNFLPEVTGQAYVLELSRLMYSLFVTAQGRSLALFTSHEMLRACAELLAPHLAAKGIDLLAQSASLGRDAMTEAFRAQDRPTVLFGAQSFWEGVDVVGDALSCVVIARLPFETYGDPLFKARCEKIEQEGRSSFAELSLPQAVIRFRQGFGRLIRSRADRGVVVVADTRIVAKSYGSVFAGSLPVKVEVADSRRGLVARLRQLLQGPTP